MCDWFADDEMWREMYDLFFGPEKWEAAGREVDAVLALAGVTTGPVLDLCCGPGRHALALADRGFRVTGVDASPYLLERAARNAAERGLAVEWVREDMREFVRPEAFALAINLFSSFGYFEDAESDARVLRNVCDSLRPGGALVIDTMSKEVLARTFLPFGKVEQRPDGTVLTVQAIIRDEWTAVTAWHTVIRDGLARTFELRHSIYSAAELKALLLGTGFAEVRCYGNAAGAEYGAAAARLVAVARKPPL
jgi:SAM-dependent methyltransferase